MDEPYSYQVPDDMDLKIGDFIKVPLGARTAIGVVWDGECEAVAPKKLRQVIEQLYCPPMSEEMRKLVDWVADYTLSPAGMVMRMVLSVPEALAYEEPVPALVYNHKPIDRMTSAREKVLSIVKDGEIWSRKGLSELAGVSMGVIDGMIEQGCFDQGELPPPLVVADPDPNHAPSILEAEQQEAADQLIEDVKTKDFACTVLHGVTGSGKTEVYFEAIAACLRQGKEVLILNPEIALTSVFMDRFEHRFGAYPAQWHSAVSKKKRERTWRQINEGRIKVVVGARSALFLPFKNLGLIIVDEEHDTSYKQEEKVFYNARDMAVVRGHIEKCAVILASATPSIETRVNANHGRYQKTVLSKRYSEAQLPSLKAIDMRKFPPARGEFLSPKLIIEMKKTIAAGEQAMLFLNRRGYAPLTLCRGCGHRFECENCSAWLVEHRYKKTLNCHHCGHVQKTEESCPSCGALDHLVACGPGVERIAEETSKTFPDARVIVLSSDMGGGIKRLRMELEAIAKGEADIIIGTQLIAKGHNFPLITCVGVVDADLGLANGDPRAAERTFQLLAQVTGRAGRAGGDAIGLLQTYSPEHPALDAIIKKDEERFYEREIDLRERAALPPFGRLAALIISAEQPRLAQEYSTMLRQRALNAEGVRIMGPAEAPLFQVRGRYRYRLLVQSPKNFNLSAYLKAWLDAVPKVRGSLRVQVDVDPISFN
jgi:primosomal protein N' (replication factor Y)